MELDHFEHTLRKETGQVTKSPTMITIPAGKFIMGTTHKQIMWLYSKAEWARDWHDGDLFMIEQPPSIVELEEFEIAIHPVTNAEYHAFIWNTAYRIPKNWDSFNYPEGMGDHPVTGVSLIDAQAFCKWLSENLGKTYRLPTEAEWEKAAKGGENRIYPWGDDFDPWRCNTAESGKKGTTPVGVYSPGGDSLYGVADMMGNIMEWTSSILTPYPYQEQFAKIDAKAKYVIRGGSWYYSQKLARCSSRDGTLPSFVSPALGFRLVSSKKQDT